MQNRHSSHSTFSFSLWVICAIFAVGVGMSFFLNDIKRSVMYDVSLSGCTLMLGGAFARSVAPNPPSCKAKKTDYGFPVHIKSIYEVTELSKNGLAPGRIGETIEVARVGIGPSTRLVLNGVIVSVFGVLLYFMGRVIFKKVRPFKG